MKVKEENLESELKWFYNQGFMDGCNYHNKELEFDAMFQRAKKLRAKKRKDYADALKDDKSLRMKIVVERTTNYRFSKPLVFYYDTDDDNVVFLLVEATLPLNFVLEDIFHFERDLEEYLDFLVESYVKADDSQLNEGARKLKQKLKKLLVLGDSEK